MDNTQVNNTHEKKKINDDYLKYKKYFEDRLTETHNLILNEYDFLIREQLLDLYKNYIILSETYKNTYNNRINHLGN